MVLKLKVENRRKGEIFMISEKITIKNEQGLHMRPAGVLAKTASKYPCDVKLVVGDDYWRLYQMWYGCGIDLQW